MIATQTIDPTKTDVALFSVSDSAIAEIREKASKLSADTKDGYEMVRAAIAETRGLRGAIEARRVELKADALSWGRRVDSEAGRLKKALLEIEQPLREKKKAIDDAAERERRAFEDAERLRVEEEARAHREAEDQRLAAERERQRAEDERQRQEREKLLAVRDRLAAEQAKVERERQAIESEKRRVAAEAQARKAALRAEQEAAERAEREKVEAAARIEREKKEAEEEAARQEALKPDKEKLAAWGDYLMEVPVPQLTSEEGASARDWALKRLRGIRDGLRNLI